MLGINTAKMPKNIILLQESSLTTTMFSTKTLFALLVIAALGMAMAEAASAAGKQKTCQNI